MLQLKLTDTFWAPGFIQVNDDAAYFDLSKDPNDPDYYVSSAEKIPVVLKFQRYDEAAQKEMEATRMSALEFGERVKRKYKTDSPPIEDLDDGEYEEFKEWRKKLNELSGKVTSRLRDWQIGKDRGDGGFPVNEENLKIFRTNPDMKRAIIGAWEGNLGGEKDRQKN